MSETLVSSSPLDSPGELLDSEPWFVPIDVLQLIFLFCAMITYLTFLYVVVVDKTCHTVPAMLVANSSFSGLSLTVVLFWFDVITLHNDVKRISWDGSLCVFRAYLSYVTIAALFYSYLLQAIYRYLLVVHPTRLFWQSARFQISLIGLSWVASFLYALPHILTGELQYLVDDQICQMPLHLSIVTVYNIIYVYFVPMNGIIFIYIRLIRYVKQINRHATSANTLVRLQRELRMVRRIIVVVSLIVTLGMPYTIFVLMGLFSQPLKYHFRIALIFVEGAQFFVALVLFAFTDPVRTALIKRTVPRRTAVVRPIA